MGLKSGIAKACGRLLAWGLRNIARRPAGNLPGKVAVAIDPHIIAELRSKARDGIIVVVGTNGKTTVTNLLADVLEGAGFSVMCNRTGANLDSGIASTLIQAEVSDWGVLECDELWSAKVVPELAATHLLLLNLFRDQLDRCGEIDRIQDAIVSALVRSPSTVLIYNADDPLCAFVAKRVAEERAALAGSGEGAASVAFGVVESMNLAQNAVADAAMCQVCSHMLSYEYRQYGQLGAFSCGACGFARPALDFAASGIEFEKYGLSFDISHMACGMCATERISAPLAGSYMVYNLLGVFAAASSIGVKAGSVQQAIRKFDPQNGRLQRYRIDGHDVLLNLAKNPTGFNQNLRIVAADTGAKAVAFFINDQVVDGHDISWIWDIDFEELVAEQESGIDVFAGGERRYDLQVRLKVAGIEARLIDGVENIFAEGVIKPGISVYAIANYSALPPVHAKLDEMAKGHSRGKPQDVAKGHSRGKPQDVDRITNANLDEVEGSQPASASEGKSPAQHSKQPSESSCAQNMPAGPLASSQAGKVCGGLANGASPVADAPSPSCNPIVIAHMLPDLLNLYGDGGNIRILEQRLSWRGIPVEVRKVRYGERIDLEGVDLMFLGGGPDREQALASSVLMDIRDDIRRFIEAGGALLAICGGYQILGRTWLMGNEEVPGLSLLGIETRRPGTSADRLVGNIALETPISKEPVIGYENHAGRTYLDAGVQPFGQVVSKTGKGNNDADGAQFRFDGVLQGNVLGTYLHGTLLAKNPEIADWLLSRAIERNAKRTGTAPYELDPLPDSEELAANAFMAQRII